jgi:hypothetical protein
MPPLWRSSESPPEEDRALLIQRLAGELSRDRMPQLQLVLIMVGAGGAAFLASVLLLWSPADVFEQMAPRYAVAAVCGYAAFLALIRAWIALHQPPRDHVPGDGPGLDVDPTDVLDVVTDLPPSGRSAPRMFGGGRTGGAGASEEWSPAAAHSGGRAGRGWNLDIDLDEGVVWIVVAGACAAFGFAAIGYVIYTAPVLLAEVALDAAIVSALYRRLRSDQRGYWLSTVLRRTWAPALILFIFAFAAGFALQQAAPQARSIGAVIQSVSTAR